MSFKKISPGTSISFATCAFSPLPSTSKILLPARATSDGIYRNMLSGSVI